MGNLGNADRKINRLAIEELVLTNRCQARATLRPEIVEDYLEAMLATEPEEFPPVDVWLVDGTPILVDGFHRIAAAVKAGIGFVDAVAVGSTEDPEDLAEAEWYASGVNLRHGLRRSNEDKRIAVRIALHSEIGIEQSEAEIARHCGVSRNLVRAVREELELAAGLESSKTEGKTEDTQKGQACGKTSPTPKGDETETDGVRVSSDLSPTSGDLEEEAPDDGIETGRLASAYPPWNDFVLEAKADLTRLRTRLRKADPTGQELAVLDRNLTQAILNCDDASSVVCEICEGTGRLDGAPHCEVCKGRGWTSRFDFKRREMARKTEFEKEQRAKKRPTKKKATKKRPPRPRA